MTSQAIRLTGPGTSGGIAGAPSAVHFVPVTLSAAGGQPVSSTATGARHASGGSSSASNLPTVSFRAGPTAIVAAPRQSLVAAAGQQSNTTPVTDTSGTWYINYV